jgi:hypothetical protein
MDGSRVSGSHPPVTLMRPAASTIDRLAERLVAGSAEATPGDRAGRFHPPHLGSRNHDDRQDTRSVR